MEHLIAERVPQALRGVGPFGLHHWQWLALPAALLLAFFIGIVLGRISGAILAAIARRTTFTWDDRLLTVIQRPLWLMWAVFAALLLIGMLSLPEKLVSGLHVGLRMAALLVVFWVLVRLVGIVGETAVVSTWAQTRPSMRSLVPLAVRVGRVAVAVIGLIVVLTDLDYKVTSLLAGLGIGGLALALAAQKTVENLFGAFSIGFDQPFSVGDFITVDGMMGSVESIGLRSTRLRTPDRTVVTIPNGKLADLKIETVTARDRIRLFCVLCLVYGTSAAQLRAIVKGVEGRLRAHPKIFPDDVAVRLRAIAPDAFEIEIGCWFLTTDYGLFRDIRQDMLLGFVEEVERAGTALAHPTRTVQLAGQSVAPAGRPS